MKKTAIYLAISTTIIVILSYALHNGDLDRTILSNSFFIVGIVLLIGACLSSLISWSIHKRFTLNKLLANKNDIDNAKVRLKIASKQMSVYGSIYMIISLVLAI